MHASASGDLQSGHGHNGDARKRRGTDKKTALQKHVLFFDRDGDGIIWPQDTFIGFYRLGYGIFLSFVSLAVIHLNFAYWTQKSWIPDPFLRIHVDRIHRDKHGSDTGTYDNDGLYIEHKFERIFNKYSSLPEKDGLTISDTLNVIYGQRCIMDPIGWGAAIFEWVATWILLWGRRTPEGAIKREDLRKIYDGSIYEEFTNSKKA
ncbi:Caleosin [Schizophyllum amplum]|uniref:Caleosin n=1 Tax=Schizophyllum amplum TaxID=97359 RepID=A0A550CFH4_9AGAR|nr:Caleosin [Auriculariopsis ampla]